MLPSVSYLFFITEREADEARAGSVQEVALQVQLSNCKLRS